MTPSTDSVTSEPPRRGLCLYLHARHNRLARYRRDAAAGNLRVLCRKCNRQKGALGGASGCLLNIGVHRNEQLRFA